MGPFLGDDEHVSAKMVGFSRLIQSLTILYLFVEIGRRETNGAISEIRESIGISVLLERFLVADLFLRS